MLRLEQPRPKKRFWTTSTEALKKSWSGRFWCTLILRSNVLDDESRGGEEEDEEEKEAEAYEGGEGKNRNSVSNILSHHPGRVR